ncbi:pyridoxamine 5'-phosphate oxidase family protein [Nocardioides sp. WS12]|uniref:pyridoxamine 5'-phosphate oxidase family protein n=1 Tax=Nocardioides sp. WS12 TaxID=2486272 RepID=UPI0015FA54C4|nr:pyridoxamine 5'-phosphate oxidase family protein [Nocardioides sp. WS12]
MSTEAPLSPTPRTTVTRGRNRMVSDRAELHAFLADGLVAHLGVTVGDHPLVLPAAYAIDVSGPDAGGTLYVHGSVAAGWLRQAQGGTVCVTVTEVDGLVAGRSAFHHSMNYRSAVVIGAARVVDDEEERQHALDLIVDHMIPGRSGTLRPSTRKELAATAVLAIPLAEASMKARAGDPVDEPSDVAAGVWGGYIPLARVAASPVSSADSHDRVPADVVQRAEGLGRSAAERGVVGPVADLVSADARA